jgi:anti-sigma regulatory factor (Ser/Thr protein kinase)
MARPLRPRPAGAPRARRASSSTRKVSRFRMESRRASVAPAVRKVLAAAGRAGLSGERQDDLAVALSEALSNAAVHGNRLRPDSFVRVTITVEPGCFSVAVADGGAGFDSAALHDPTHPERILLPGGRGVFLMSRLVDELEYNEAGNRVRLTMRLDR